MMSLKLLVPDATVNYITNPQLRYDTTGWNAQGSSISRVLTRARFGIASLEVTTNGAALNEGAFFRVSSLTGVSEPITVSAYVRGSGKVRIRLDNNVIGGTEFSSDAIWLNDTRWQRISITGFSTGGNDLRLFVETAEGTAKVRTFYVDGAQMERKGYMTSYCDGDTEGCRWDFVTHAGTSSRLANTRLGGKWVQLAGEERAAEDLYMTVAGGLGMAPLTNNTQEYALQAGGYVDNYKVGMRVVTLTFHAKHTVNDVDEPVSLAHLHDLRQMLIDVVKPDLTGKLEPMTFEYLDGDVPLYFKAHYDGGLEGEWDIRNQFVNSFPLRLLAADSFFWEDTQEAAVMDFQSETAFLGAAMKKNGVWNTLNYGVSPAGVIIRGLAFDKQNRMYIGSDTTLVLNNNAAAIDPLRACPSGVAYFDGEKWVPVGTGSMAGGSVQCMAINSQGYIFIGGSFTSIGGVANTASVAYWDGSAWKAMGSGLTGSMGGGPTVYGMTLAPNGDLYCIGDFTTSGALNNLGGVAKWDGGSWSRLGQYGGFNAEGLCVAVTQDGKTVYCGGSFTDQRGLAGNALIHVAKYTVATGLFSAMGSGLWGLNSFLYAIAVSKSGVVYAGGYFDTDGGASSTGWDCIAQWSGSNWTALGLGVTSGGVPGSTDPNVRDISINSNDEVLVSGHFLFADGKSTQGLAIWRGNAWYPLDTYGKYPQSTWDVYRCKLMDNGDIYGIGDLSSTGARRYTPDRTSLNNFGTLTVAPIFYLKGPGKFLRIHNVTTGKIIYMEINALNGEEIFINPTQGTIQSSMRGNLLNYLYNGSDLRSFFLTPGSNDIYVLGFNDVNAQMSIQFPVKHWSVDATQVGGGL